MHRSKRKEGHTLAMRQCHSMAHRGVFGSRCIAGDHSDGVDLESCGYEASSSLSYTGRLDFVLQRFWDRIRDIERTVNVAFS